MEQQEAKDAEILRETIEAVIDGVEGIDRSAAGLTIRELALVIAPIAIMVAMAVEDMAPQQKPKC